MKGKFKVLSLLLAVAMAGSMFAACTGGDDSGSGTGSTTGTGDKKEVVTLKWWHWGDPPKNPDAVIEALNKKSAEDIGVKIDFIWATGDDAKLKTALSTGADDDIAFTCSWFARYATTAQKGQLLDITDKLQTVTPKLYEYLPEYLWKGATVNGKIYAVPTYKDSAAAQYWTCNKEYVFDGAGAEAEFKATNQKVSSVTPVLKKVKEYADAGNPYPHDYTAPFNYNWAGLNGHGTGWDTVQDTLYLGCKVGDDTYTVKSYYDDPDYMDDLHTLQEWYKNGYVNADCEQLEKEPEFLVVGTAQGWEGAEKSVWGVNKDYTVEINKKFGPIATTSSVIGSMNGIFANSKHPDEALKYIEYINLDEGYRNMLAYGVEGQNYTDNGDGTITKTNSDWEPGAFAQATFFTMKPVAPAPADMYSAMKDQMDNAEQTALMGFVFDETSVKTEVAACANIKEKYYKTLQCGTAKDVDATVAKLMEEWNAAGYQKVLEEAQKQVNAFLGK